METFFGLVLVFGFFGFLFWLLTKGIQKKSNKQEQKNTDNHFMRIYMNSCTDSNIRSEVQDAYDRAVNKLPIPLFLTDNFLFYKNMGSVQVIPLSSIV